MQNHSRAPMFTKRFAVAMQLCAALGLSACQGTITGVDDSPADDPDETGGGGAGSPSGMNGGNSIIDPEQGPVKLPVCNQIPAAAPLRRLTRIEYINTVRDLFAGIGLPPFSVAADPIVGGLENNAAQLLPTQLLVDQGFDNARTISGKVAPGLLAQLSCKPTDGIACGRTFIKEFGARAFRRPLDSAEATTFERFFAGDPGVANFPAALTLTVQAMLSAPQFLYHLELSGQGSAGPWEIANRLSYLLWQSMPDPDLVAAAQQNDLSTPDQVNAQIDRMLADPKAAGAFVDFARQWLHHDRLDRETKLAAEAFDEPFRQSMREERRRFVEEIIWNQNGTLADLLTSPSTFVDSRLAKIYGVAAPASGWQRVELDPGQRAGVLTQTAFLAGYAHPFAPSPVLRGVFILDRLLCDTIPPPPNDADQTPPDPKGQITNREAYRQRTQFGACAVCHEIINPIGFTLENYDTMGRFRTTDNALPVDATGTIDSAAVDGGVELAQALGGSAKVSACAARYLMRSAFAGAADAEEGCLLQRAEVALANTGGGLRAMLGFIAREPSFLARPLSAR